MTKVKDLKLKLWRLTLRKGWYEITWNSGFFPIKDRAYWNGENFTENISTSTDRASVCDVEAMSIFVRRLEY